MIGAKPHRHYSLFTLHYSLFTNIPPQRGDSRIFITAGRSFFWGRLGWFGGIVFGGGGDAAKLGYFDKNAEDFIYNLDFLYIHI